MTDTTLAQALTRRRSGRDFQERPISLAALQSLLWAAQGITDESGKRTAPSAHALHPLRLMVLAGRIDGLEAGAYAVHEDRRGLRYLYIESGAAAQNVQLQAASEGLACVLVAGFRDETTAQILGLEAPIAPVLHLCFGWPAE